MAQVCPNCNASNDDTVTFCLRCGTRLNDPTDTIIADFSGGQGAERPKWLMPAAIGGGILLCLAVVAVAAGIYFGWYRGQEELSPTPQPTAEPTSAPEVVPSDTPAPPSPTPEPDLPTLTALPPTDTPTPEEPPTAEAPPSPTPNQYGLMVGIEARIFTTEGDTLRMRNAPGTQGQVIANLPHNTPVTIVDGPETDTNNLTWWKVRTQSGTIGWCVEFVDGIQTLQPQ
jgi:hypothetical protein